VSSEEEKNKALTRRFLEARVKGDLDTMDVLMAPEFDTLLLSPTPAYTSRTR
jgi:ketosteroid isomerase-like protein